MQETQKCQAGHPPSINAARSICYIYRLTKLRMSTGYENAETAECFRTKATAAFNYFAISTLGLRPDIYLAYYWGNILWQASGEENYVGFEEAIGPAVVHWHPYERCWELNMIEIWRSNTYSHIRLTQECLDGMLLLGKNHTSTEFEALCGVKTRGLADSNFPSYEMSVFVRFSLKSLMFRWDEPKWRKGIREPVV